MTESRLRELERAERKLRALEAGGVDNWEFYDESLKDFNREDDIDARIDSSLTYIEEVYFTGVYEPSEQGAGFSISEDSLEEIRAIIKSLCESILEDYGNNRR